MIQNYSRYKLLQEFFDYPRKDFQIRELSRKIKLAQISVINHLKELVKENLIIKEHKSVYPSFRANMDNEMFKLLKKQNLILRIKSSGLIDFLWNKTAPKTIILYGSYAKGESLEESDIDIFIIGNEKEINLEKFEEKIGKKIHILFEKDPKKIPKELKNNLVNGIILKGYLKLF